ncbi:hypothetical protein [Rhizobium halophytocola]|uniref:Uncharacterized protein n=1 Tax=Rhizobium halophytocola TaxID=735519 RepID=A0ABS4DX05_9HYPH|nr:hypothetical protein [Rhizobium halophytocola]MBP1850226.1 hypothetical protein [Rhizobium halophytocola]
MPELVLFHPFKIKPPRTDDVLRELHAAFSMAQATDVCCSRCLVAEHDEPVCAETCLAVTDPVRLLLVYNVDSSEAVRTGAIRHLLPHALETMFFDEEVFPNLAVQAFRSGAWFWSEPEQAALRDLFFRVAINWFAGREPEPLALSPDFRHYPSGQIYGWRQPAMSSRIIEALILMRVRPEAVMDWLVETGGRRVINWIVQAVTSWTIIDRPGDEDLRDLPAATQQLIAVKAALNRLANHALFNALTPERLFGWWQECLELAPELVGPLEELEAAFCAHDRQLSHDQQVADLALIETFLASGNTCRAIMEAAAQG